MGVKHEHRYWSSNKTRSEVCLICGYCPKVINMDCLKYMKTLNNKSIDLILTDPPYGLDVKYSDYEDSQENLKNLIDKFVPEAIRVAKRVVIFPGINNVHLYPKPDWIACWFYGTTGNFGKLGYNSWQPMLFYGKNNRRYGMDTIKYSKIEKRYPGHPCSKPVGLMELIVDRFSDIGETVLDIFAGTGSTGIACINRDRKYILVEKSKEYCDIINKRIKENK